MCSPERGNAPAIVLVIGGGRQTVTAACEAIVANIPVLIYEGSGKVADFIAAAYYEQPLVLQTLHSIYVICYLISHDVLVSTIHYNTTKIQSYKITVRVPCVRVEKYNQFVEANC